MKSHLEAATTGFVSLGLREVRFPDIRWTLDRLTVEHTDFASIYLRTSLVLAGVNGRDCGGGQECDTAKWSSARRSPTEVLVQLALSCVQAAEA